MADCFPRCTKVGPACTLLIQFFNSYSWLLIIEPNKGENSITRIVDLVSYWVAVTSMPESRGVLVCQLDCLASRALFYLDIRFGGSCTCPDTGKREKRTGFAG